MPQQRPCPGCGGGIILAAAPRGGWVRLDPFPDPAGRYRVAVRRGRSTVVDVPQPGDTIKRYDRHRCATARNTLPRPGRRPEQLTIGDT